MKPEPHNARDAKDDQGGDMLAALFRAEREHAPDTSRTEFAFETRVLARVREERKASMFSWAWKLSPFFAALAIVVGIWCYSQTGLPSDPDALLSAIGDGGRTALAWLTEGGDS